MAWQGHVQRRGARAGSSRSLLQFEKQGSAGHWLWCASLRARRGWVAGGGLRACARVVPPRECCSGRAKPSWTRRSAVGWRGRARGGGAGRLGHCALRAWCTYHRRTVWCASAGVQASAERGNLVTGWGGGLGAGALHVLHVFWGMQRSARLLSVQRAVRRALRWRMGRRCGRRACLETAARNAVAVCYWAERPNATASGGPNATAPGGANGRAAPRGRALAGRAGADCLFVADCANWVA